MKPRTKYYYSAVIFLAAMLGIFCVVSYSLRVFVRSSGDILESRTVSQSFKPWEKGFTTPLVIKKVKRDTYEIGFKFPTKKLERGRSFEGLLHIEIFEDGDITSTRDVSKRVRGYFSDTSSYRIIALAYFDLPTDRQTKQVNIVVTVVKADGSFSDFQDLKLFVRPSPVM